MKSLPVLKQKNKAQLQTTTKQSFLEIYNPESLEEKCKGLNTIKHIAIETIKGKIMSLGAVCRKYGSDKVETIIKIYLVNLNEVLDLKRPLKEEVIEEIASVVVSDYPSITMADVRLIFRNAKTGAYGEFYESLSMPKVVNWFRQHYKESQQAHMEINYNNHLANKGSMQAPRSSDDEAVERAKFREAHRYYMVEKMKKEYGIEKSQPNSQPTANKKAKKKVEPKKK